MFTAAAATAAHQHNFVLIKTRAMTGHQYLKCKPPDNSNRYRCMNICIECSL